MIPIKLITDACCRRVCVPFVIYSIALAVTQSLFAEIVINEIHYDPDVKTEWVEFIELYNSGTSTENLSGWRLTAGVNYIFPGGTTLVAGSYLVVAQTQRHQIREPVEVTRFDARYVGAQTQRRQIRQFTEGI